MNNFETMSEALEAAEKAGYGGSFKLEGGKLCAIERGKAYTPDEVTVVNHHRFEGQSSGDDMSIVYLIECNDGTKGSVVDAFGAYSDAGLSAFFKKVSIDEG